MLKFLKKKWLIIVLILVAGLLLWLNAKRVKQTAKKEENYIVKRRNLKDTLSLSGEIDADERVVLRFQSSGRLSWVGVKEGDVVKKYQGIASLDQRDLKKKFEKYMNSYMTSRWSFEQSKDDNDGGVVGGVTEALRDKAQRLIDKSQYDLNSSVLDVELQDLAIQYSYLSTPIEGIVVRVDSPFAGVNITPSQAEFEVINPKTIYFSVTADQTEVVKLKENTRGNIVLDAYPEKEINGVVKSISYTPKSGETGTVYKVKINISNGSLSQYRYGMTGDINFDLRQEKNVIAIPTTFVKTEGLKKYVYMNINEKRKKVYVKLGDEMDNYTIVKEGLSEGDIIY
jgi:membrane fusion protein, multidrug efflux system